MNPTVNLLINVSRPTYKILIFVYLIPNLKVYQQLKFGVALKKSYRPNYNVKQSYFY